MKYWLLKTEPHEFSWQQQIDNKTTAWDGVRNYQARNFMKEMQINDLCFFYHTGNQKKIMGLVKVIKPFYPDSDERFVKVDVEYYQSFNTPITLATIKSNSNLQNMLILKQPRLSVCPVDNTMANILLQLAG